MNIMKELILISALLCVTLAKLENNLPSQNEMISMDKDSPYITPENIRQDEPANGEWSEFLDMDTPFMGEFETCRRAKTTETSTKKCLLRCECKDIIGMKIYVKHFEKEGVYASDQTVENCLNLEASALDPTYGAHCSNLNQDSTREPYMNMARGKCTPGKGWNDPKCTKSLGSKCECPDLRVRYLCNPDKMFTCEERLNEINDNERLYVGALRDTIRRMHTRGGSGDSSAAKRELMSALVERIAESDVENSYDDLYLMHLLINHDDL